MFFYREELEKKDREIERLKHQIWDLERRLDREIHDHAKAVKEVDKLRDQIQTTSEVLDRFTRVGTGQVVTMEVLVEEFEKLHTDVAVAVADRDGWKNQYEELWAAVPAEFKVAKKLMEAS